MTELFDFIQRNFLLLSIILYLTAIIFFLIRKYTFEIIITVSAFVLHSIYLASIGYYGGIYLFLKVTENSAFLPWAMALIMIIKNIKMNERPSWGYSLLVIAAFSIIAFFTPPSMAYFGANKQSIWTILFMIFNSFAPSFFFLGTLMAILYLLGVTDSNKFHPLLIWGFIFHTLVHVTGGIWCFLGWATIFQWVYVHLQSAAEWIYYANYLHLKFLQSWTDRHRAIYAIAGAVILLIFKYS